MWCLTRIVADSWKAILGPEGRPIDPVDPQLHRHDPLNACAGVNMGVVQFHLDARELDPVWLEGADGRHIVPSFTSAFRPVFQPDLVLVDGSGRVVVRDGLQVDPNGNFAGHFICATGTTVYFD